MPVFEYKGLTAAGKGVSGLVDADTPRMARQRLKEEGIYPTDLVEGKEKARGEGRGLALPGRVAPMELAVLTRQIATLVGAGIPMLEALTALVDQVENPRLKKVVAEVREQVKEGASLSEALKSHPRIFSELYVSMVAAGEASGTLSAMLERLAEFTERQVALSGEIKNAMIYPILLVVVGVGILAFLLTAVMPQVTRVFVDMDRALPAPTQVLMSVSAALRAWWWALLVLAVAAWLMFRRWVASEGGRLAWDRLLLGLPLVGKMVRMVAISRFTRTLSTLLAGGIPLLEALSITQNVVLNRVLADAIGTASENIKEGEGIAAPLAASGVFPPMVTHMITVGEATGELEEMLNKVAEAYDREVSTSVQGLMSVLSPVMVLTMAGAVFAIVLAILLPLIDLSGMVG